MECVCFLHNTTNDYTTVKKHQETGKAMVVCGATNCVRVCLFTKILYLLPVKIDFQLLMQTDCSSFSSLCVSVCVHAHKCVCTSLLSLSLVVEASILRARVGWQWSVEAPPPPSEKSAEFDAEGGGGGGATRAPISMLML